jgi:hypothetical protein
MVGFVKLENQFDNAHLKLIIAKDKYGSTYYSTTSVKGLHKISLHIINERFKDGYYEDNRDEVKNIIEKNLGRDALRILADRCEYEYEEFYIEPIFVFA